MTPLCFSPAGWVDRFLKEDAALFSRLMEIYGNNGGLVKGRAELMVRCLKIHRDRFASDQPVLIERVPAKLNVLGSHIDHRGAPTNAIAVNREIFFCFSKNDTPEITVCNADPAYGGRRVPIPAPSRGLRLNNNEEWLQHTQALLDRRKADNTATDWEHKIAAVPGYLRRMLFPERPLRGFRAAVLGDIPVGCGLSSSSALVVGVFDIMNACNDLGISDQELVLHAGLAEWYVGTRGGAGDHAGIKLSRRGRVTALQTVPDLSVRGSAVLPEQYRIVVFDSGIKADKTGNARNTFNEKVACYEFGELFLWEYVEAKTPGFVERLLEERKHLVHAAKRICLADAVRHLSREDLISYLKGLPRAIRRKELRERFAGDRDKLEALFSTHPEPEKGYDLRAVMAFGVSEVERSEKTVSLLSQGDIRRFADFLNFSHDGDRVADIRPGARARKDVEDAFLDSYEGPLSDLSGDYHCSHPDIDRMADIALSAGALGARIPGAGLGGSLIVLAEERKVEDIRAAMEREYCANPPAPLLPPITAIPIEGAGLI